MIKELTCIECPMGCKITVETKDNQTIISGNGCPRGKIYAENEIKSPKRVVTSTVKIIGGGLLPVKTDAPIDKTKIFEIMKIINNTQVSRPIKTGDIIIENVFGANVISAKTVE